MMNYISTVQAATKWGITANRVSILAKEGRISGAVQMGYRWLIPENTEKPQDGRKKSAKAAQSDVFFRFPLYVNFAEEDYVPPLSEEERLLRQGQLAFHACRFDEANQILIPLSKNAKNRYVRLSALYHRCYLAIYDNSSDFDSLYLTINTELSKKFPYQKEMQVLRYRFDTDFGFYKSALEEFQIDPNYSYHSSAYYVLTLLSLIPIENGDFSLLSKLRYDTYELLCQQMEQERYFCEAQELHYLLVIVYQLQENKEKMSFHIRRGLKIALEHGLYWNAISYASYYPSITKKVLSEFPTDFIRKIHSLKNIWKHKMEYFATKRNNPSFINILSEKDYEITFLANQGYTNREIAGKLNLSEKTVSKHYSEIYDKLGVHTKNDLIQLINSTHRSGQL